MRLLSADYRALFRSRVTFGLISMLILLASCFLGYAIISIWPLILAVGLYLTFSTLYLYSLRTVFFDQDMILILKPLEEKLIAFVPLGHVLEITLNNTICSVKYKSVEGLECSESFKMNSRTARLEKGMFDIRYVLTMSFKGKRALTSDYDDFVDAVRSKKSCE